MFQRNRTATSQGFTLVELLFAMSFVSVLLIIILTSTLQVTRIYNKGITLKQVNQSGAAIGSDMLATMKSGSAKYDTSRVGNGRICLGSYSYVWNLQGATTNRYASGSDKIGMVKVRDPNKSMCAGSPNVPNADASELILGSQDTNGIHLELRDMNIALRASSGINFVYNVTYTISTSDHSLILSDGSGCSGGAGDEFCALNQFSFDVYARTGGNGVVQ